MSSPPRRLPAHPLVDFSSELAGYSAPALSAAWDGSVCAIARLSTESPMIERGVGAFPKSKLDVSTEHVVPRWRRGSVERVAIHDESLLLQASAVGSEVFLFDGSRAFIARGW